MSGAAASRAARYDAWMTLDDRARTPADVPVAEMERLLSLCLGRGGTFADLYFEHERTSSLLLEEGIIRTASAGMTCGLGVRVVSGERTGYAYTDDLSWEAMARAAETAAHIASDLRTLPPHVTARFQPVHQLDRAVMLNLQPLGHFRNFRFRIRRHPFDRKKKLVLARLQAGIASGVFAEPLKPPNLVAKLGQGLVLALREVLL